jgi:uncharacterized membrane protein HdeD (DUF308 family)
MRRTPVVRHERAAATYSKPRRLIFVVDRSDRNLAITTKEHSAMVANLASKWWVFLVQGAAMIILAVLAFVQPETVIRFIGAYAIIDGVLKVFSGLGEQPDDQSRWPALIIGVLSVIVGLVIWANPVAAAAMITLIVAAWAVVVGILLILWAIRLRQEISDEWTLIVFGVLSVIFGILVFNNILAGMLSLAWIFAIYMVVGGIMAFILGFRVKELGERLSLAR